MKIARNLALEIAVKISNDKIEKEYSVLIRELRILLANACCTTYEDIFFNSGKLLTKNEFVIFMCFLHEYLRSKPISKIIKRKYFYNRKFFVNDEVLDPREDSETIIDLALSLFPKESDLSILDIGTGSGCLIVTLLIEFKNAKGLGIDISKKVLEVAITNANSALYNRDINFEIIDFLNNCDILEKFDLIVSNPPYIKSSEIENLDYNVKQYDPIQALDGGKDGLIFYRAIAQKSESLLHEDGIVIVEIGYNQFEDVCKIFEQNKFSLVKHQKDNSGIKRALAFRKNV